MLSVLPVPPLEVPVFTAGMFLSQVSPGLTAQRSRSIVDMANHDTASSSSGRTRTTSLWLQFFIVKRFVSASRHQWRHLYFPILDACGSPFMPNLCLKVLSR